MTDCAHAPITLGRVVEVFTTFLKLGCTSFGGPIAHIAYFRRQLVEQQAWVTASQFSQLLAICQFLPGPASSQLGFSLGMVRAGWWGALAAFVGFTLPSVLLLLGFVAVLPLLSAPPGQSVLQGLKLLALVVVADAVWAMSKKFCPDIPRAGIAVAAGVMLLAASGSGMQMLVVGLGAVAGLLLCQADADTAATTIAVGYGKVTGGVLLAIFLVLLVGLPVWAAAGGPITNLAEVFYRTGALVFGGGHVVLPLLEEAVVTPGWVSSETFLAGYGVAQIIPGPLFAFSAYLGAAIPTGQVAGMGLVAALLFIFLPGFLLVAGVLPFWRSLSRRENTSRAIGGVNAAVVGLLAVALYDPIMKAAIHSGADLIIGLAGVVMSVGFRMPVLWIALWCVVASIITALV